MAGTVFIFGLGYVGRPLGQLLASRGWQIRGTTRTPERLAADAAAGWQVYRFADDVPLTDPEEALDGVDAVLSTITAIGGSDPVLDAHGDVLSGFTGWSGYVSATSVYPDRPDGFCYEDTPTDPATKRGKARVIAEARWQELLGTGPFRAAGIYGPSRSPSDSLRDGTARIIQHRGQPVHRIPLHDLCRVSIAAMNRPRRGRIVNLVDEKPAAQGDVVRHAAGLLGVSPPEPQGLEEADLSAMARSFYVSRRRVGSKVIGPELGVRLLYPDYESGLAAILEAETAG